ncbi:MAG TPA: penicillin-binding protein activator [Sphingomonas sp.]|uniref:penicillin-binding protein activator n=1 Tax=Sphingomonas sp. TaxID=28214 RepID=UPI002C8755E8|nr:penicillin-binding protein activator [Sphingomonas sp.]HMI20580.1 penicillin-binding protein activator [Sphingomonas sp.]
MADAGTRRQSGLWSRLSAIGLAMLLAACSTVVPRGPAVAPPVAKPVAKPAPQTGLPEDVERHRIALLVPLSGPNAAVGQSIADAAAMALADTGGKALRITNYDTAQGAEAAARKALADGNKLFLGPLLSDDVRAVAGPAEAAGVPVISFSNDSAAVGDDVWLLGFSPAQSIDRVVRFAKSRGLTRFAGLMPPGTYGRNASSMLIHTAEAAGGSVAAMQSYQRTPTSIAAAIQTISKEKFDAVLIADSGRIAVTSAPLIRKAGGAGVRILGTELWNAEPSLNNSPVLAGAWFASVDDTLFKQFSTRYRTRYGRTPYRLGSLGYDAVLLTVRIAKDWKLGSAFPVDALADDGGFSGVDGAFRFSHGHIAERALAVHQLGPGGGTIVSPAPSGF